jgi:hypothetical protein
MLEHTTLNSGNENHTTVVTVVEVLAMNTETTIATNLTPCSLLKVNRYFQEHVAFKISTVVQWIARHYINLL